MLVIVAAADRFLILCEPTHIRGDLDSLICGLVLMRAGTTIRE